MPLKIRTNNVRTREQDGVVKTIEVLRGETGPQGPKGDPGDAAKVPIASTSEAGIIKPSGAYGTQVNSAGILAAVSKTEQQYAEASNALIVGKGTLDNVLGPVKSEISQLQTALIGVDEAADALMEVVGVE